MLPKRGPLYDIADIDDAIAAELAESETLEYKSDPAKLDTIVAKAVSAFANSGGGTLVLGIGESAGGRPSNTDPPGLPSLIGRVPTGEHVDRIIRTKVVPNAPAAVQTVAIPGTDRVYVVAAVAPRGSGPFRIVGTSDPALNGRYYMRRGRESLEADHHYLRRLFAEAQDTAGQIRAYLDRRGFGDEHANGFMTRGPVNLLAQRELLWSNSIQLRPTTTGLARAAAVVMPTVLRGDVIDTNSPWLREAMKLSPSSPELKGFGYSVRPTVEGRMLENPDDGLLSDVEVHRTGYIEAARCDAGVLYNGQPYIDAITVLKSLHAVLGVANRVREHLAGTDEWLVGLFVSHTAVARLFTFLPPDSGPVGRSLAPNLRIEQVFEAPSLDDPWAVLRTMDLRLANAFGLEEGRAVLKDGGGFNRRDW